MPKNLIYIPKKSFDTSFWTLQCVTVYFVFAVFKHKSEMFSRNIQQNNTKMSNKRSIIKYFPLQEFFESLYCVFQFL